MSSSSSRTARTGDPRVRPACSRAWPVQRVARLGARPHPRAGSARIPALHVRRLRIRWSGRTGDRPAHRYRRAVRMGVSGHHRQADRATGAGRQSNGGPRPDAAIDGRLPAGHRRLVRLRLARPDRGGGRWRRPRPGAHRCRLADEPDLHARPGAGATAVHTHCLATADGLGGLPPGAAATRVRADPRRRRNYDGAGRRP